MITSCSSFSFLAKTVTFSPWLSRRTIPPRKSEVTPRAGATSPTSQSQRLTLHKRTARPGFRETNVFEYEVSKCLQVRMQDRKARAPPPRRRQGTEYRGRSAVADVWPYQKKKSRNPQNQSLESKRITRHVGVVQKSVSHTRRSTERTKDWGERGSARSTHTSVTPLDG